MKKVIYVITVSLFMMHSDYAAAADSLSVSVSGDTVYFWNYGVYANCASAFMLGVYYQMYRDTIYLAEIDTMTSMDDCNCYFDLSTKFTLVEPGHYYLKIYRYMPYFSPGSVHNVGILEFEFQGNGNFYNGTDFQSDCYYLSDIYEDKEKTDGFYLEQNYPNPFNPSTIISWQSPVGSWQILKIYDVLGKEIVTLVNEEKPAGNYVVEFNTQQTTNNRQLASGVYFYKLQVYPVNGAGSFIETKKLILMK